MTNEELKNQAETILSDYMNYQPVYFEKRKSIIDSGNMPSDLKQQEDAAISAFEFAQVLLDSKYQILGSLEDNMKSRLKEKALNNSDISSLFRIVLTMVDFVSKSEMFLLIADSLGEKIKIVEKADDLGLFDKAS